MTSLAIDIWFHTTTITDCNVGDIFTNTDYLNTKLMTRDSRVAKERHFSKIATVVSPADTDCFDPNKRLSRLQLDWFWYLYHCPSLGFNKLKCLHKICFHSKG
jgi:hypothetical protein